MKKIFIIITLASMCFGTIGAAGKKVKPQLFLGMVPEPHEYEWYSEQALAWASETRKNPLSEQAWKYYFMSAYYMAQTNIEDTLLVDSIVNDMEAHIKDTYTYNYCKFRQTIGMKDVPGEVAYSYAYKALEMLPKEKDFFDFDVMLAFCATHKNCPQLQALATEYFNSGIYSPYVLDFTRNELRAIPSNAIYIGNADVNIIPKWILCYGNNEFTGIYGINFNMLTYEDGLSKICDDLGITDCFHFPETYETREEYLDTIHSVIRFIKEKTGRPIYFTTQNSIDDAPWNEYLYHEGLSYKYSEEDYDILPVIQHNLESVYDLKTMQQSSVKDAWYASDNLALEYVIAVSYALYGYAKQHDKPHAKWAYNIGKKIISGINYDKEGKKYFLEDLTPLYECAMKGLDPEELYHDEEEETGTSETP